MWGRNGNGSAGGAAVGRGERDGIEEERVWRYVEGGRRRGKRGTRIMGERKIGRVKTEKRYGGEGSG